MWPLGWNGPMKNMLSIAVLDRETCGKSQMKRHCVNYICPSSFMVEIKDMKGFFITNYPLDSFSMSRVIWWGFNQHVKENKEIPHDNFQTCQRTLDEHLVAKVKLSLPIPWKYVWTPRLWYLVIGMLGPHLQGMTAVKSRASRGAWTAYPKNICFTDKGLNILFWFD